MVIQVYIYTIYTAYVSAKGVVGMLPVDTGELGLEGISCRGFGVPET